MSVICYLPSSGGVSQEVDKKLKELENLIEQTKALRADLQNYGLVRLSNSAAITDSTGLALPASEKNASIAGTLANGVAGAQSTAANAQTAANQAKTAATNAQTTANQALSATTSVKANVCAAGQCTGAALSATPAYRYAIINVTGSFNSSLLVASLSEFTVGGAQLNPGSVVCSFPCTSTFNLVAKCDSLSNQFADNATLNFVSNGATCTVYTLSSLIAGARYGQTTICKIY